MKSTSGCSAYVCRRANFSRSTQFLLSIPTFTAIDKIVNSYFIYVYRKSVLHLLRYSQIWCCVGSYQQTPSQKLTSFVCNALIHAVQICGKFLDTQ